MKMQSTNVILLILLSSSFSSACLPHANRTTYFCSKNFHNILHWRPMEPTFPGEKVLYSVSYASYTEAEPFKIKAECQNITKLACDMTEETPSLHNVYYRARVHANGRLLGITNRFKPIAKTIFGRPKLNEYTKGSSLYIEATLPSGPKGYSIEDIIINSKHRPIKTSIHYTLHISSPDWAAEKMTNTIGKFIINMKNNHTEYCGNVFYWISSERGRPDSEPAKFCVQVQDTHKIPLPWPLMSAALLAAIVVIAVVSSCIYMRGGKRIPPQSLQVNPLNAVNIHYPSDDFVISKPTICTPGEKTLYTSIKPAPLMLPVGYFPQDICNSRQNSISSSGDTGAETLPSPDLQETSSQSSNTYGSVVVQTARQNGGPMQVGVDDGGIGGQQFDLSRDEGGASQDRTSHGAPAFPDPGVCERSSGMQLLLHTTRDGDGKLILPSLPLQSVGGPDSSSSPLHHERRPLLSDLKTQGLSLLERLDSSEFSDSGCDDSCVNTPTQPYCNSNYLSSKGAIPCFQSTFTSDGKWMSGYKQNWMPATPPGTQTGDDCPSNSHYIGTNFPSALTRPDSGVGAGESVDVDWNEGSSQIHLGSWMVQIQE